MKKLPKHILVTRFSAMGDVAMSVPVLRAFTKQHPNTQVTVVSRCFFKPLFKDIPNVIFHVADTNGNHKGVTGLYQLHKELQAYNIDAVADLHNVIRSKILRSFFKMKGISVAVIDKGRTEKKALTRTHNKVFKQLKTTQERYADVFRKLGFSLDLTAVVFSKPKELNKKCTSFIGIKKNTWIGIAPFAKHTSKVYPLDLLEEVLENISKKEVKILLFGGGDTEVLELEKLEKKFPNTISAAGKCTFEEELTLISQLDCMLSMDSGNAHLAAVQGVKTITLWGITHPFAGFAPFMQTENCILPDLQKYPNIPCSIYGNKTCEGYKNVMRTIKPTTVIEKILAIST